VSGNVEWVVTHSRANIRSAPRVSALVVGHMTKGQIVTGRRQGSWLELDSKLGPGGVNHSEGWMAIHLVFKRGLVQFLRRRTTTYVQIRRGNCKESGIFPIITYMVCSKAAAALGYRDEELRVQKDTLLRPEGCHVEVHGNGSIVVGMATNPNNQGRGALTSSSGDESMEPLCSKRSYPDPATGFMTSAAVRKRVQQVDFALAKSKAACKKSNIPCAILWRVSAQDLHSHGLAHSLARFQPLRAYVEYSGCDWVVSHDAAQEWKDWKLAPFWTQEVSQQRWQIRWEMADPCRNLNLVAFGKAGFPAKCEGFPGLLNDAGFVRFTKYKAFNGPGVSAGGVFAGAYDLFLQTFGPRLVEHRPPYDAAYVGFKLPLGKEGDFTYIRQNFIIPLLNHWPHMQKIFVTSCCGETTVSGETLIDMRFILGNQFSVTTPAASSDTGGLDRALNELVGLASAAILIGDPNDHAFHVARDLNLHLHAKIGRPRPWCFDVRKKKICR